MAMIALPENLPPLACSVGAAGTQGQDGVDLREVLRETYGIDVKIVEVDGIGCFCRLSFAVFNTQLDVFKLRDAILDIAYSHRS